MNELKPGEAVMQATIEVKRAATGKVDTYTLTFTPVNEPPEGEPEVKPEQENP